MIEHNFDSFAKSLRLNISGIIAYTFGIIKAFSSSLFIT